MNSGSLTRRTEQVWIFNICVSLENREIAEIIVREVTSPRQMRYQGCVVVLRIARIADELPLKVIQNTSFVYHYTVCLQLEIVCWHDVDVGIVVFTFAMSISDLNVVNADVSLVFADSGATSRRLEH